MNNNILAIAAGALALYYAVLRGANAVLVAIRGYQVVGGSFSAGSMRIRLNFWIKNPLLVGLRLKGVYGDVYLQGVKVGEVANTYDYYIAGRQAYNVPVLVDLDINGLSSAMLKNIESGDIRTLTVSFDGAVSVGGDNAVRIPVQKTVTWEEMTA